MHGNKQFQINNAKGNARVARIAEFLTGIPDQEQPFLERLLLVDASGEPTELGKSCLSKSGLWLVRSVRRVMLQYIGLHDVEELEELTDPTFDDPEVGELLASTEQLESVA